MKVVWIGIMLAACIATLGAQEVKPKWSDKITLKGDLRLREENIRQGDDSSGKGSYNQNRLRLRARIAAEAAVNEDLKAVLGLSSGDDDPVSSNQTFGEEFSRKPIRLELAYLEWTPAFISEMGLGKAHLLGGKMKNPFLTVSELIWDGDVNPEGLAISCKAPVLENLDLLANAGSFWFYERKSDPDTMLYVGQLGLKLKNSAGYYVLVGGSYYHFQNVKDYGAFDYKDSDSFYGNSSCNVGTDEKPVKVYACEFHEIEGMTVIGFPFPVFLQSGELFADYVKNLDPDSDNIGYQVGARLGKLKEPGDIALGYAYRKLEKDATMGAMTDSDWWGGGTDGKGHQVKAGYQLMKNWTLNLTYFFKNTKSMSKSEIDYDRFQLDLVANF